MAKLPGRTTCVEFTLADGIGRAYLRAPSIEELNNYQADRVRVPDNAERDAIMAHFQAARVRLFDLLLERFEDLEDDTGATLTVERKDLIPDAWKAEAIARKFDVVPVSVKN